MLLHCVPRYYSCPCSILRILIWFASLFFVFVLSPVALHSQYRHFLGVYYRHKDKYLNTIVINVVICSFPKTMVVVGSLTIKKGDLHLPTVHKSKILRICGVTK